jgi:hypothetical protein
VAGVVWWVTRTYYEFFEDIRKGSAIRSSWATTHANISAKDFSGVKQGSQILVAKSSYACAKAYWIFKAFISCICSIRTSPKARCKTHFTSTCMFTWTLNHVLTRLCNICSTRCLQKLLEEIHFIPIEM